MNNRVFCTKCGTSNPIDTKFCSGCGQQIQVQNNASQEVVVPVIQQEQNIIPQNNVVQQNYMVQQNTVSQNKVQNSTTSMNYFKYMFNVILKPHTEFKNQETNLSSFKNSVILSIILVSVATIINLFVSMFNAVRYVNLWTNEVIWTWENLKNVEYFKIIGQNLLLYSLIIIGLSGIYFLAALVIKKDSKFSKLLGASVTAFLPIVFSTIILVPILSMIHTLVGLIVGIVGIVYGIIIFIELVNDMIVIENKNHRIYYHMSCLSIYIVTILLIVYFALGSLLSFLS